MENSIEVNRKNKLSLTSEIFKYLVIGLYVLFTGFLVYILVSSYKEEISVKEEMFDGLGFALIFVIFGIIFGGIGYGIIVILSIIGLVISLKDKLNKNRKLNNICFILGIILPIITEILIIVLCKIAADKM